MMPTAKITVLVLHQNPLVSAGLAAALGPQSDIEVKLHDTTQPGPRGDALATLRTARLCQRPIDVVIADYSGGLQLLAQAQDDPQFGSRHLPRVLIVSPRQSELEIRQALECGARGYLQLGCRLEELVAGVRTLHHGLRHLGELAAQRIAESLTHKPLTEREAEVLRLIAIGLPNKLIATRLGIAVGTVKAHTKGILGKLEAGSRTEAVAVAGRRGLLPDPDEVHTLPDGDRAGRYPGAPLRSPAARPFASPAFARAN